MAIGIGTGTAARVQQDHHYPTLSASLDKDLQKVEDSVPCLEDSLSSLDEVALPKHMGLDLLFLKQGGLCTALGGRMLLLWKPLRCHNRHYGKD